MNENDQPQSDVYRCPGEKGDISRAIHLGRLAAFYPACRQCPRRHETGSLSRRQVAQLAAAERCVPRPSPFVDDGAAGVFLNDITPAGVRRIAMAFATALPESPQSDGNETRKPGDMEAGRAAGSNSPEKCDSESLRLQVSPSPSLPVSSSPPLLHSPSPSLVLCGDARPLTAEITAAAADGIRASGCHLVDIGPATTSCLALAVQNLHADGGLAVGNPGGESQNVGLKFFNAAGQPFSRGGSLDAVLAAYEADVPTPSRRYGDLHRVQAEQSYLAALAPWRHALRPLRVAVDSASKPWAEYFQKLLDGTACEIVGTRTHRGELPERIHTAGAHLGVCIDGDGETCRALDEQGREVSPDQLFFLLATTSPQTADRRIVWETGVSPAVLQRFQQAGMETFESNPRRESMATAMFQHKAVLGGGPSGCLWWNVLGLPLPDALITVMQLLKILSRSDEPFSRVLDRDAKIG